VVRDDIPFDRLSAQIAHAARKSAGSVEHPNTHAVVLAVPSVGALMHVYNRLLEAGVACVLIEEPDPPFFNAPTCLGCFPVPRQKIRRLLSGLPLLRATDKP
jgi:hypothetical protein